jgi:hypothetical protein
MAKARTDIPRDIAARVLFESDRTCCVCRERGKPVQIHHVDEDPENHVPENLSVLCFDCHHLTQLSGGFDRKLDAHQVLQYRADWLKRVMTRRDLADQLASTTIAGSPSIAAAPLDPGHVPVAPVMPKTEDRRTALLRYLEELPRIRRQAYEKARPLWDSGVTSQMMQGNYDLVDVLQQILVNLAVWYPPKHFGDMEAQEFMSAMTASRFVWHRAHLEPGGGGTGGTIIGVMAGGDVTSDLEAMVVDMVRSLTTDDDLFHFKSWLLRWEGKAEWRAD